MVVSIRCVSHHWNFLAQGVALDIFNWETEIEDFWLFGLDQDFADLLEWIAAVH